MRLAVMHHVVVRVADVVMRPVGGKLMPLVGHHGFVGAVEKLWNDVLGCDGLGVLG